MMGQKTTQTDQINESTETVKTTTADAAQSAQTPVLNDVLAELETLKTEFETANKHLERARQSELRALADYQNLVRRNQDDQRRLIKMASRDLVQSLVQPLHHLGLAARDLKNAGLDMVIQQFWSVLNENGVKEIDAVGKKFDANSMEVVEKKGDGDIVVAIAQPGYTLNGEVIQVAKVIVN
jgi:molecular chaperone GrpE